MRRLTSIDIVAIAWQTSSQAELLTFFPSLEQFCLLSSLQRRHDSSGALTYKASSNLLNDDTYQCVCAGNCVIHPDK